MRVLIVAEGDSWGGIETHLMSMLPHYISNHSLNVVCLLFYEGALSRSLNKLGVKVTIIRKKGLISTLVRIRRLLRQHHFDVVHTHSLVAAFHIFLSTLFFKCPVLINTLHGKAENLSGLRWLKDYIARKVSYSIIRYRKRSLLIAVSNDLVGWASERMNIPISKIQLIRNGLDCTQQMRVIEKTSFGFLEKGFLTAIIGRLTTVKGHIYLLEAVRSLIQDNAMAVYSNFRLLIIGDGPLSDELKSYCAQYHLQDNVKFLGHREDALQIVSLCDTVILSSIHEGIPYSLLEAMCLEKTIIATNVGGIREVLTDNYDALLIPSQDSSAIKDALIKIISDPQLANNLAHNAKMTLKKSFSAERMANDTITIYRQFANK